MENKIVLRYELTTDRIREFLESRDGIEATDENVQKVVDMLNEKDHGFGGTTYGEVSVLTNEYEMLKSIAYNHLK